MSYLDDTGLAYFWTKIKAYVSSFLTWANIQNKPSTFAPSAHSHGNITNAGELGTASRAVVTDGNKKVSVSSVTSTELEYLSGVTSNVQTQLNGKADASAIPAIPSLSRTVSGSGNAITDITVSGHAITATKGSTFLTSHQTLPTLSLTTSGSGNAITALSVSNHAITATKGSTFLTSHQDISGKVDKSGDTMTGDLILNNKLFKSKVTGVTRGTSTTANYPFVFQIIDNANVTLGGIYYEYLADKTAKTHLMCYQGTTNANTWQSIGVGYNASGNVYTWAPNPVANSNDTNIATTKWVNDKGYLTSVSGTAGTSLLAWNTENTVYTIGGHAIKVKLPANPNTNWTSHLYAGASNGSANAATTNGNTYLIICDNNTARDRRLIKGTGATTVTSDANGVITINSTDNNTTYSVSTTGSGNAVTSVSLSGTAITATKGSTFLTSHQSLANYVTLNSAQTISATKTFSANQKFNGGIERWGDNAHIKIFNTGLATYSTKPSAEKSGSLGLHANDSNTLASFGFVQYTDDATNRAAYIRCYVSGSSSTYRSVNLNAGGNAFFPGVTKQLSLGRSDRLWTAVYAQTSTIQPSDERVKQAIEIIPNSILDAWEEISWKQFKLNDSVEEKGFDKARLHTGLIAQQIDTIFRNHNLDISKYGLFCYDEWGESPAERNDDDEIVSEPLPSGNQYAIRYEEALCVEAAYQRRENARLRARIASLEDRLAALELRLGSD